MQLEILKKEEKRTNLIMFLFLVIIPIVAFLFVFLFNGGSWIDLIILTMPIASIIIHLLERTLGSYAKYLYTMVMPVLGALTIIVGNDGVFGAFPEAFILTLFMAIPYYDVNTLKVNAIATVVPNAIGLLVFPVAYLKMRTLAVWVFCLLVYTLALLVAIMIVLRARELFATVETHEKESEHLLKDVENAFENLEEASGKIYGALQEFEANTEEIAASTQEISTSADRQIKEVDDSLLIFNTLNDKIANSEARVNQTVDTMVTLKNKNDEGIAAIGILSEKFDENIKATKTASEGVADLSQKSSSIGGIIESIREIAQQTNLLALNAAIEAARAGEAGKGFAVVADEINSLSAESSDATGKIDTILKDIIDTVENTNRVIEKNSDVVNNSSEHLEDTIKIFKTMLESSEEVIAATDLLKNELSDIVTIKEQLQESMKRVEEISKTSVSTTTEISAATEQQVAGVDSIVKSMQDMQHGVETLSRILHKNNDSEEKETVQN